MFNSVKLPKPIGRLEVRSFFTDGYYEGELSYDHKKPNGKGFMTGMHDFSVKSYEGIWSDGNKHGKFLAVPCKGNGNIKNPYKYV